jgi:hypothetical protein
MTTQRKVEREMEIIALIPQNLTNQLYHAIEQVQAAHRGPLEGAIQSTHPISDGPYHTQPIPTPDNKKQPATMPSMPAQGRDSTSLHF